MSYFVENLKKALQTITNKYQKKETLLHLMVIRYGLDGGAGATLEEIGQRDDVSLTRERVRQIVRQGRELLHDNFLNQTHQEMELLLKAKGWIDLEEVIKLDYFSDLKQPQALSYWLDDIGYRRWQHQGTLYFYDPNLELKNIQNKIRSERKKNRKNKSELRRSGLVSSAIKMPKKDHLIYWNARNKKGLSLMGLYQKAIEYSIAHPQAILPPPPIDQRREDVQVGLRLNKNLMTQLKKLSKQKKWGITLFIRQALLAYLPQLKEK